MRIAALFFGLILAGCGSTRIISEDPTAEIFINNRFIGVGEAEVNRVGPPHRARLEARKGGETVGRQMMHRHFSFMTVVWGFCSYYTGFYWGWYYPNSVIIPLDDVAPVRLRILAVKSPWEDSGKSIWMKPLE